MGIPILIIRPFDPDTDFPSVVRLLNVWQVVPTTEEAERVAYAQWSASPHRALVAENDGTVIGYGRVSTSRGVTFAPGSYHVELHVLEEERRRGAGRKLYESLAKFARENGATELRTRVRDTDEASRAFAERRGYTLSCHSFLSYLDVTTFDPTPWADAISVVEAQGIRLVDFATLGDTPENRRALYAMNRDSMDGEPGYTGEFADFATFEREFFHSKGFFPECQILAIEGDRLVGIAALLWFPGEPMPFHAFTGVLPEYRRRGIAQALKIQIVEAARQRGATKIRTGNDSRNTGMLAINRRMGYVSAPGLWRMVRAEA